MEEEEEEEFERMGRESERLSFVWLPSSRKWWRHLGWFHRRRSFRIDINDWCISHLLFWRIFELWAFCLCFFKWKRGGRELVLQMEHGCQAVKQAERKRRSASASAFNGFWTEDSIRKRLEFTHRHHNTTCSYLQTKIQS